MRNLNIILLLVFIMVISVTVVCASDYSDEELFKQLKNSECSSIILQISENESVASFRRDEVVPADIFVRDEIWKNITVVEQYKHRGGDFFQAIITEDGWFIGCGGQSDGDVNHKIKNLSSKIVLENDTSYIYKIQEILSNYENGHVVVKNPQGNYVIAFVDGVVEGRLHPGEYICVSNMQSWFDRGSFDSNPVNNSIKIASKDKFGVDRRNIMTYYYNTDKSGEIGLDIYASNDDGSFVDIETGDLADNIDFNDKYILAKNIPKTPDKMHIGHFVFKEGSIFKLLGLAW